jgi:hypothetical protein
MDCKEKPSIIRVEKNKDNPYVMINKGYIDDKSLSWQAKGLMTFLLSKPDTWKIYLADLKKQSKNGRDATAAILQELIKAGYMQRKMLRDSKGHFCGYDYTIFETKKDKSENGVSDTDNPNTDNPNTGNPTLLINESSNNNINNIKDNVGSSDEQPTPPPVKPFKNKVTEKHKELASILLEDIRRRNPKAQVLRKPNYLEKEADYIRMLFEIDKWPEADIRRIINFACKSDFWQSNILSCSKLREKRDTLLAQSKRKDTQSGYQPKNREHLRHEDKTGKYIPDPESIIEVGL